MEGQPVHGPYQNMRYMVLKQKQCPQTGKASTSISMHHIPHCVKMWYVWTLVWKVNGRHWGGRSRHYLISPATAASSSKSEAYHWSPNSVTRIVLWSCPDSSAVAAWTLKHRTRSHNNNSLYLYSSATANDESKKLICSSVSTLKALLVGAVTLSLFAASAARCQILHGMHPAPGTGPPDPPNKQAPTSIRNSICPHETNSARPRARAESIDDSGDHR